MKRVLIIDDHRLIFDGLKMCLPRSLEMDYADNHSLGMEMLASGVYFAAIIDVTLGKYKGFDLIPNNDIKTYCFFLSMHKSSRFIKIARDQGGRGYFLKDESPDLLIKALSNPASRDFWISPELELELTHSPEHNESTYDILSLREQQVFRLFAEGIGYKEIAFRLNISAKTVNNHRDNIMKKLSLDNQADLVKSAIRLGVIDL